MEHTEIQQISPKSIFGRQKWAKVTTQIKVNSLLHSLDETFLDIVSHKGS